MESTYREQIDVMKDVPFRRVVVLAGYPVRKPIIDDVENRGQDKDLRLFLKEPSCEKSKYDTIKKEDSLVYIDLRSSSHKDRSSCSHSGSSNTPANLPSDEDPHCCCVLCLDSNDFGCDCVDCKEVASDVHWRDSRTVISCLGSQCSGWLAKCIRTNMPVGVCLECKQPSAMEATEVKRIIEQGIRLLQISHILTDNELVKFAEPILEEMSPLLPYYAYPVYPILQKMAPALLRIRNSLKPNVTAAPRGSLDLSHLLEKISLH